MSAVDIPLMIRTDDDVIELRVRLARPMPFAEVAPELCRAAGLAPDTALFHGIGPLAPDRIMGEAPLLAGCLLATRPAHELPDDPAVTLDVVAGPSAGRSVAVDTEPIRIGRAPDNDLVIADPAVSAHHALVRPAATGMTVTDLRSTNGVFVDGTPLDEQPPDSAAGGSATARSGATIRVGNSVIRIQFTTGPAGSFTADGTGYLVRAHRQERRHESPPTVPDRPTAPQRGPRRALPISALVVGLAVGGGLAFFLHQAMFLAFAAFGPLTMAASALSDKIRGRRSYRRQRADYRAADRRWRAVIGEAIATDRHLAWRTWPGPAELLRRAGRADARLWERGRADPTYLILAGGTGPRSLRRAAARGPGHGQSAPAPDTDVTAHAAGNTGTAGRADGAGNTGTAGNTDTASGQPGNDPVVTDVPLTLGMRGVIRLAGPPGRALARWLVAQLVALHSPADVALLFVAAGSDLGACRYLPHTVGWIACPGNAPGLEDVDVGDHDVVAVLDGTAAATSPLGAALVTAASDASAGRPSDTPGGALPQRAIRPHRISVLVLDEGPPATPAPAASTQATPAQPGSARASRSQPPPTALTGIDAPTLTGLCRALAPLREGATTGAASLPHTVELPSITGPLTPEALQARWREPTATAILGAGADGPVRIDLVADGPHLLIAGTTGSGKSELLQTLVAGLACSASPDDMTLLLVDYKGGAAFDAITGLPHVVGVLTDLDPTLSARALASLRAELRKREARQAAGHRPGPKLAVVIDEFATLAVEVPDFLAGVLDIAQRGRSLGVHLIMATQRPAGVVSPAMRANISTRICLRVTDPSDSADVIDAPDAARLSARYPGRAILRTHDGARPFQTALVSVPAPPEIRVGRMDDDAPIPTDGEAARPTGAAEPGTTQTGTTEPRPSQTGTTAPSVLASIVATARGLAADREPPEPPWLPPLPARVVPDAGHPDAFALADIPDEQRQEYLAAPSCSVLVTGSTGSGRSTALRRLAGIAATDGGELLVIDPTGALAGLADWPQVSSYLDLADPRLVLRLLRLLTDPASTPADGRTRHVVLDHYDLVAGELERADYLTGATILTELITRSPGAVRLLASGPGSLAQGRAAGSFPAIIRLGGDAAPAPPGRGMYDDRDVQLMDCPDQGVGNSASRSDASSTTGRGTKARWRDPLIVRPVPATVAWSALPAPTAADLPIGLGGDAATAVTVDLGGPGGAIVVGGPRRSGVSTALDVIGMQALRAGIRVIRVTTGGQEHATGQSTTDGSQSTTDGPESTTVIDVRDDATPLQAALAEHVGPLVVVADAPVVGGGHPAAPLFDRFLSVCGPGQHLVIGERTEALARAHSGYLRAALGCRRGLLLSPDSVDGALLDVSLPRRRNGVIPGRGAWIDDGTARPLQVALPPERCDASR